MTEKHSFAVRFLLLVVLALALCHCATIEQDLGAYQGEVYLTPPPPGVAESGRLVPFRAKDNHVYVADCMALYRYRLDRCLLELNPKRFPVYNLRVSETYSPWESIILISEVLFGYPCARTVEIKGHLLVPTEEKLWFVRPKSPFFGVKIERIDPAAP